MNQPAPSDFSVRFAAQLRGVMAEYSVTQPRVAEALDRTQSYVSEHTSGKRAPEMDIVDAVASLIPGMNPRALVTLILERMAEDAQ